MREETREKIDTILDSVAAGASVETACNAAGLSFGHFIKCVSSVRELDEAYARARAARAFLRGDQIVSIADDPDIDPQRARNMIDARKFLMVKENPRAYGERMDLNLNGQLNILDDMTAASKRSIRDRQAYVDAQIIDTHSFITPSPSDSISETASPALPCDLPGQLE